MLRLQDVHFISRFEKQNKKNNKPTQAKEAVRQFKKMLFLAKNGGSKMITLRRFVSFKAIFGRKNFFQFFTWDLSDSL
jgi:hypothetical protein